MEVLGRRPLLARNSTLRCGSGSGDRPGGSNSPRRRFAGREMLCPNQRYQPKEQPVPKPPPVLVVERIEDCLPFWCDRLGFARTVEVPHGDSLGFVILQLQGAELMLQSRASAGD